MNVKPLVEEEINEQINLWEDENFLAEIDMRLDGYESGILNISYRNLNDY